RPRAGHPPDDDPRRRADREPRHRGQPRDRPDAGAAVAGRPHRRPHPPPGGDRRLRPPRGAAARRPRRRRRAHRRPPRRRGGERGGGHPRDRGGPAAGGGRVTLRMAVVMAWRGLRANGLRSLLTMLGIMIGVAAVILLVGLGNGTSARLNSQLEALGTNLIGVFQARGSVSEGGQVQPLTDRDVEALRESTEAPRFVTVTPVKQASAVIKGAHGSWRTSIVGSSQDYPAALNRTVEAGKFFTESQVRTRARVVVLGPEPVRKVFGGVPAAALGEQVRIGSQMFEVVGVLKPNGQQDDLAVMPITAVRTYLVDGGADDRVDQLVVQATGQDAVPAA